MVEFKLDFEQNFKINADVSTRLSGPLFQHFARVILGAMNNTFHKDNIARNTLQKSMFLIDHR